MAEPRKTFTNDPIFHRLPSPAKWIVLRAMKLLEEEGVEGGPAIVHQAVVDFFKSQTHVKGREKW